MSGYGLGQSLGYGLTEQSTIIPGTGGASAVPAAGAEYTYTLSRYDRWRLIAVRFSLTTSSTDQARNCAILYSGSATVENMIDPVQASIPKSITKQRCIGALNYGSWSAPTGLDICFPLSGLWLEAGSTVKIAVVGIDTTDQLADIRLTFDRFPGGGYVPAESDG